MDLLFLGKKVNHFFSFALVCSQASLYDMHTFFRFVVYLEGKPVSNFCVDHNTFMESGNSKLIIIY